MDPEVAYQELKEAGDDMRRWQDSGEDPGEPGEYYRIADVQAGRFQALDEWLSRGGFLPAAWRRWREEARASGEAAGFVQGRRLITERFLPDTKDRREHDLDAVYRLRADLDACKQRLAQLADLEQLFGMQNARMAEATALWRAENPQERDMVAPDLGKLLSWLIQRGDPKPIDEYVQELAKRIWEAYGDPDSQQGSVMAAASLGQLGVTLARALQVRERIRLMRIMERSLAPVVVRVTAAEAEELQRRYGVGINETLHFEATSPPVPPKPPADQTTDRDSFSTEERERVTFTNGTAEPMTFGDKTVAPGETVELHGASDADA